MKDQVSIGTKPYLRGFVSSFKGWGLQSLDSDMPKRVEGLKRSRPTNRLSPLQKELDCADLHLRDRHRACLQPRVEAKDHEGF